jgi:hypothetical protein
MDIHQHIITIFIEIKLINKIQWQNFKPQFQQ